MNPENAAVLRRLQTDENYGAAIVWSVALHAGIVLLLVFRLHFGSPELPSIGGEVIEAVVVDYSVIEAMEQKGRRQAEQAAAERRQREAERRAAEEQKRRAEQERLRVEQERQLVLQRQAAEKQAAEQKRQQEQRQKEAAASKAEEKRKQEEARKAEERVQLEAAQRREQEQLQAEAAAATRRETERKELASARELYMLAIQQKVERHWIKPPTAAPGQVCRVLIRQIPGGEVVSVEMETSTGDSAFDRSVEQAVYMASPLPEPSDPRVFDRALRFTFRVP
jgi:colicin import membrane protein